MTRSRRTSELRAILIGIERTRGSAHCAVKPEADSHLEIAAVDAYVKVKPSYRVMQINYPVERPKSYPRVRIQPTRLSGCGEDATNRSDRRTATGTCARS